MPPDQYTSIFTGSNPESSQAVNWSKTARKSDEHNCHLQRAEAVAALINFAFTFGNLSYVQ
jgi:hypothetical protein